MIVPMHLRKMPLKYWGMASSPSGPWGLRSSGHHGRGGFLTTAGTKHHIGIWYILQRNSTEGGVMVMATATATAMVMAISKGEGRGSGATR